MITSVRYLCGLVTDPRQTYFPFPYYWILWILFFLFSFSYFRLHPLLAHHPVIFAYLFRSETVSTLVFLCSGLSSLSEFNRPRNDRHATSKQRNRLLLFRDSLNRRKRKRRNCVAIYVLLSFRFVCGYSYFSTFGVLFDVLADDRKGGQKEMQSQK